MSSVAKKRRAAKRNMHSLKWPVIGQKVEFLLDDAKNKLPTSALKDKKK